MNPCLPGSIWSPQKPDSEKLLFIVKTKDGGVKAIYTLGIGQTQEWVPPPASCVLLAQLLNLSEPQLPFNETGIPVPSLKGYCSTSMR